MSDLRIFEAVSEAPSPGATRVAVLKAGKYKYAGEALDITRNMLDRMVANHKAGIPGGPVLVSRDHADARSPRNTEADGWANELERDGDYLYALTEWTPRGESALKNKLYRQGGAALWAFSQ